MPDAAMTATAAGPSDLPQNSSTQTEKPRVSVEFRPVIDAAAGRVSAEYVLPRRQGSTADEILLEGSTERIVDQSLVLSNLRAVLRPAGERLTTNIAKGQHIRTIVPVNVVALTIDSLAGEFANLCHEIDDAARENLVFEVVNLPKSPSLDLVDHLAILLFPFCGAYIARPDPSAHDIKVFTNCNFTGVSFDLKDKPWPIDTIRARLDAFKQAAAMHRLAAYLHGCATPEIAVEGNGMGFEFLDGPAVPV